MGMWLFILFIAKRKAGNLGRRLRNIYIYLHICQSSDIPAQFRYYGADERLFIHSICENRVFLVTTSP